jgi:hypothetical protein
MNQVVISCPTITFSESEPAVRGLCMREHACHASPGIGYRYHPDNITDDSVRQTSNNFSVGHLHSYSQAVRFSILPFYYHSCGFKLSTWLSSIAM